MRLLILCDKYAAKKEVGASDAVSRAIRFINDNIFDSVTLEDVAAAVNMSKYHFCIYLYKDYVIWGLTARMLYAFLKRCKPVLHEFT